MQGIIIWASKKANRIIVAQMVGNEWVQVYGGVSITLLVTICHPMVYKKTSFTAAILARNCRINTGVSSDTDEGMLLCMLV